jgi:DNA-binding transcriptional regulator YiaG
MKGATITEWVSYHPNVGTEGLQVVGIPGSGKSNLSNRLVLECLVTNNENFIIAGDRFCEFRHFYRYPKYINKIILLLPDNVDLVFYPDNIQDLVSQQKIETVIEYVDFNALNIMDYITEETERNLIVVYDNHFFGLNLWRRGELWVRIVKQLLERTVLLEQAIGILWHEAGILWQQQGSGDHWKAIHEFSELVVECRKGLVRLVLVGQIETEIESTIRKKLGYVVYKQGSASRQAPELVQKIAPFQARHEFIVRRLGLYTKGNVAEKFEELKKIWKIIPIGEPNFDEEENEEEDSEQVDQLIEKTIKERNFTLAKEKLMTTRILELRRKGKVKISLQLIGILLGVDKSTITRWETKGELNPYSESFLKSVGGKGHQEASIDT